MEYARIEPRTSFHHESLYKIRPTNAPCVVLLQIISQLNILIVIPKTTCQAIKHLLEPYRSDAKLSSAKDINGGAHKGTYVLNAAS
jgi:hypothetical protein